MATRAIVDETVAMWAAGLVLPSRDDDPVEVARLRADVAADMTAIDLAARGWSQLGADLPPTQVRVISRSGWVRANLAAMRGVFDPIGDKLRSQRAVASRVLGAQIGGLLGLLSTKVLGQFILPLSSDGSGQLVVVGPNLLDLAEEHGEIAGDIRRTVLVHEVTHRLQFDGVDWLGGHLRGLLADYLGAARLDAGALSQIVADLPGAVGRIRAEASIMPLLEVVLSPEQREVVGRAQGLMSLLEGHGNAAMFSGSEGVVKDPDAVREALDSRRPDATTRILTFIAGLEMKKRQYRDGEAFVNAVVDLAGVEGLNQAFVRPDSLPGADEITAPEQWLERVGGQDVA